MSFKLDIDLARAMPIKPTKLYLLTRFQIQFIDVAHALSFLAQNISMLILLG